MIYDFSCRRDGLWGEEIGVCSFMRGDELFTFTIYYTLLNTIVFKIFNLKKCQTD